MYYLLFNNAKMTEHNLLNQLAKQDQATICHIDQGLSHTSKYILQQSSNRHSHNS